ncbi:twin-arginine translocase TatA/TatE family subunit [Corynebacterium sp. sy017]|uniref:Sec-independent protein translocase subunit TatA n=1 Tax=unclassified Corynebacterium TaxID=2624378 RepID=UPI001184AF1D|nr:twin-arginine translocase TatA/TatE family subunit [Corynebacterium sp. sy017]QDZ42600.1 twin-arginine translocase TatA/TatE family subunit [Corynebacterium sp. sy039]TSD92173.1 twin-arginine translocase TatA/TatE family subunit [Corynebacterium sp. SY003]
MGSLGAPEIIIIVLVIALLFGAKRLPDAARSLGRSMRILKSEVKEMGKDDEQQPKQIAQPVVSDQHTYQPQNNLTNHNSIQPQPQQNTPEQ